MAAANRDELNRFLASVERQALRIAEINLGNRDDALDAVQDAMLKLATRYAKRPGSEWKPLFYRILNNRITDTHRQRTRSRKVFQPPRSSFDEDWQPEAQAPASVQPQGQLERRAAMERLDSALAELPMRQRQVFLLRIWEGLDVAQTARAVGCGSGSVKTHLSRAMAALRGKLQENWP